MKRKVMLVALAVLALGPAVLPGQDTARVRVRERRPYVFSFNTNRGRIGVVVNTRADATTDRLGARIEAVTPGGPADRAGLKARDIITKLNGISLAGAKAEDTDESGPGMKLLDIARDLEPGDTVQVEYRRGDESKTATLVAEDLGYARVELPRLEGLPRGRAFAIDPDVRLQLDEARRALAFSFGRPWGNLELVKLNPDLGEYFGTKDGVLVVKATGDSALPLKGGDVILAIDGRTPTSPEHAMRILRSYEDGETVKVEILRKQKRQTLTWTVPALGYGDARERRR